MSTTLKYYRLTEGLEVVVATVQAVRPYCTVGTEHGTGDVGQYGVRYSFSRYLALVRFELLRTTLRTVLPVTGVRYGVWYGVSQYVSELGTGAACLCLVERCYIVCPNVSF